MSGALIALLATAIHQVRHPEDDPVVLDRTLALLTRASEGSRLLLEQAPGGLKVSGVFAIMTAPGVSLLCETLIGHEIGKLQLPGGLEARHWREIASLLAAPPAPAGGAQHIKAALRVSMPTVELWTMSRVTPESGLTTRGGNLGSFSAELSQLYAEGTAAVQQDTPDELIRVLLALHALETGGDPAQAAVVAKERLRLVSPSALNILLSAAGKPGTATTLPQALATLAPDDLERVLETIADGTNARQREVLAQTFDHLADPIVAILRACRSRSPLVVRGAADIAGRRQMTGAIQALAALLRDNDADIRVAAWRALEEIGTREAIDALTSKGR